MDSKDSSNVITIDGKDAIVGRLAAFVAKQAISGKSINIINIENAVISGHIKQIVEVYRNRRSVTNYSNPEKAVKWSRRPDLLFKRIMWGMLPATSRGKAAASRVRAYVGNPLGSKGTKFAKTSKDLNHNYASLKEICTSLGWSAKV